MAIEHVIDSDADSDAAAAATRLAIALDRLVGNQRLTAEQAAAVRDEFAAVALVPTRQPWTAVLPEVGGYVGGAFVLAAALVLAGPRWDDLGYAGQLAVLGVPSLLMIGAAVAVALWTPGGWSVHARPGMGARRRLVAVLLAVGIVLAACCGAVIADPEDSGRLPVTTAAVLFVAGYTLCRTALLHVGAFLSIALTAATWSIFLFSGDPDQSERPPLALGFSLAAVAVVWGLLAVLGVLDERQLGMFAAGALFFVAAEVFVVGSGRSGVTGAGYLMLAALAAVGMYGYIRTRYVAVLAVGVVALATVIPQAVIDYTNGALGAGGALLLVGLSIVGASVVGMRLRSSQSKREAEVRT